MEPSVLYQASNQMAWITINRESVRNAVNYEVIKELHDALDQAEKDPGIKLAILTGSGDKAFCSGGDLAAFHTLKTAHQARKMLKQAGELLERIFFYSKPTVALINGIAIGGGCELAASCDLRLASASAKIGFVQGTLGITTGWGGGTYLLERVSPASAMDFLFSSSLYTAKKASDMGFVQYLLKEKDIKKEAISYLNRYLEQPEGVLRSYKALYLSRYERADIHERVQKEIERCSELWASDEHHNRVNLFLQKKKNK